MKIFVRMHGETTSKRVIDGETMYHETRINGQLVAHYSIYLKDDERLRMIGKMVRNGWKEVRQDGNAAGEVQRFS